MVKSGKSTDFSKIWIREPFLKKAKVEHLSPITMNSTHGITDQTSTG